MLSSTSGFVDRKINFRTVWFTVRTWHLLKITGDPFLALNRYFLDLTSPSPFHLPPPPPISASGSSAPTRFSFSSSTAPAGMHAASALIQLWVSCLYPFLGQLPSALTVGIWDKLKSLDNAIIEGENKENWSIKTCIIFFTSSYPFPS